MKIDRRTLLLGAAASLLGACGSSPSSPKLGRETKALARRSVGIDYASFYAPFPDMQRLVQERARELGAAVTFSDDAAGAAAQTAQLRQWTGDRGGFRAIAVAPFDRTAVEPIAADALEAGVAIVGYVTQLKNQTAGIVVDRGAAGRTLAEHAARRGDGGVLVVRPPTPPVVPDAFAVGFADAEAAIRRVVDVRATVEATAEADARATISRALRADPSLRTILCWNDTTALGAAAVAGAGRYVGAVGAPSLTGRAAITALRRGGPLQCVVAARLADLADALVEVPLAFARGQKPGSRTVPVTRLTRGSPQLARFAADFAG
jgi:ABC-type sugar transport system substrate-binding protein